MTLHRIAAILTATLSAVIPCTAQDTDSTPDIVSHITADGVNTISQPAALARLLRYSPEGAVTSQTEEQASEAEETVNAGGIEKIAGFRVQVFSDNKPAAKGEARSKGRNISAKFPEYRTYVKYTPPYWRLRVGDFRTRREADDAADELRRAFPAYASEIRVVQDRVTISQ